MTTPTAAIVSDSDLLLLGNVAQSVGTSAPDLLAVLYADSGLQTNAGASRVPPVALGIALITHDVAESRLGMNEAAWLNIPNQSFVAQLGHVKHLYEDAPEGGYPNAVALYQHTIAPFAAGPSVLFRAPSPGYVTNSFLDVKKKGYVESEDLRQFLIARTTGTSFVDYMKRLQAVSGTPGAMPRIPVSPIVSSNDASLTVTAVEEPAGNSIPWGSIALAGAVGLGAFLLYKQWKAPTPTPTPDASSGADTDDEDDEDDE